MTPPEKLKSRAQTHPGMSSDDRALLKQKERRTPAGGVPNVEIHGDVTPPPQTPPTMIELRQLGTEDQIAALQETLQSHAKGFEATWDSRHTRDRVDQIFTTLSTVGKDIHGLVQLTNEFLMPSVKGLMARMGEIERTVIAMNTRVRLFMDNELPAMMKTIDALTRQSQRVEKDVDRLEKTVETFIQRSEEQNATTRTEIIVLKNDIGHNIVRIRQLEDWKLKIKTQIALIAALATTVTGGIAWLITKFG